MVEFFFFILILSAVVYGLRLLPYVLRYLKSNYKSESEVGLLRFLFDTGSFGEGLTFFDLEKIPTYSKILANVYLPTEDGTTEVDLIYITKSGIYVLESKNYSGWIFGNEKSRNWTSVIYKTKNKFPNPIWQNRKHVKYLTAVLGDVRVKSIVVFSERCELKKVEASNNVVVKRNQLKAVIQKDLSEYVYSKSEINGFYKELKRYSNQSAESKAKHIKDIASKHNRN